MRKLGDTLSRLAALQVQYGQESTGEIADRLSALTGFGSNPGSLGARVYVPKGLPAGAPLVVVLHGCTQTAAAYDHGAGWSKLADEERFAVLFPEQRRSNNANLCFNWFVPEDTRRDSGEAHSIRQMIEAVVQEHRLDRKRVFVTGLSAGGAMASVMLATYPEIFAGGAIIAGLPYGSANTIPEAFDRMRGHGGPSEQELQQLLRAASPHQGPWPSISIWQGLADRTVAPSNADAILGQWRGVHELAKTPSGTEIVDGHTRQVWRGADGRVQIEKHRIAGMGHGTPLATVGPGGLGAAGPFMLDVGISSTRRIAQFWDIAKSEMDSTAKGKAPAADTASRKDKPASGVRKIIEDALRTAGLLR